MQPLLLGSGKTDRPGLAAWPGEAARTTSQPNPLSFETFDSLTVPSDGRERAHRLDGGLAVIA
ncbi:hypothetical protein CBZ_20960 [Cellulomonas biazotea]|uniref:Uncharacterized protein n=1 Tax=Cellulomonas biazotea TaxID=1709 RepID=A0A402DSA8_9CELL|nr:hypothetical protein CBZ_20960 [Cellulomonas biazotea]